jgi:5'-nucleotidase
MWLNGEPIDPAAAYSVTVNSFLASGGDNFRAFAAGTGKAQWGVTDLQAMVTYMDQNTGDTPLPVDYSQRAVEVKNVEDSYTAGENVTFDVASWTMSAPGDVKDTEIQVKLGDTVLGTATLDNTLGTAVYDAYGKATVDVPLPAGTTGPVRLTLVGANTSTEIPVDITIDKATPTVTGTNVTVRYGASATMRVTVSAPGVVPTGSVSLDSRGINLGSGLLTNGTADVTIPARRLPKGTHPVTISYAGDGSVKPGTGTATVTVLKGPRR